jgi:uncharacterized protein (TIGR02145 family)
MKHLYLFGLLLFLPFLGFSQGEWNNWYFGWFAGITFNSGSPVAFQGNPMPESAMVGASVSDSLGNILFYSNGMDIYNRNKGIMPNGSGLLGGYGFFTQSVVAVPNLTNQNQYFIFTVGVRPSVTGSIVGLNYSVLDMQLDGGLGDIVPEMKNIPLPGGDSAVCQLTAIRHQNNHYVWLLALKHGENSKYLAYLVDSVGVKTVPIESQSHLDALIIGVSPSTNMRISPDGKNLICTDSLTQLCYFNSTTGEVTPRFTFNPGSSDEPPWGKEFSVDSRYLYVTVYRPFPPSISSVWQYDMNSPDSVSFMQSEVLVGDGAGKNVQMGPDWKIYLDGFYDGMIDSLCIINSPSLPGLACNYQKNSFCLDGNLSNACTPQFLQRYKAYIHHNGNCQNNPVHIYGDIWPPADSIHWDFGDPASGPSNFSNLANPSHTYSNVGNYIVELFVRHIDHRTNTTWQTITIVSSPQVNLGPDKTICTGDSTTFDAGACTGCTYLWKNLGSGLTVGTSQTFRTGQAGTYAVTVTNSNNCTGSDTVQLTTTPVPSVTNNPLAKTICSGEFTNIALTSSVPGTNFHWTASLTSGNITGFSADSGFVINQVLSNSLPTPGIVTYQITPNVGSCAGTPVDFQVTVNPGDSVKVTITASANNICAGTSVTFTANPTNPGITPVYQWKVNGINSGTNSTIFTYTLLNGDIVTCLLTSSLTSCISNNPALSNSILMVINSVLIVNISINPSSNPVCEGISVTFTATPVNGGTMPSYQWKVNGINTGTNSPVYSYVPLNGDQVNCELTSSVDCPLTNPITSNTLLMTTNNNLPVSLIIAASANPFCPGSSVTFTATPTNGGITPSYQWKVNGANAGTNSPNFTYNPVNGDLVSCVLTSSVACPITNPVTSNTLLMTINNSLPAGVSITASSNPFCPGTSVTFTSTPVNGGSAPAYQWKVNGVNVGSNSSTYSYNPFDGDSVRCIMTSNLSCVTGNPASSNKIIMSGTLAPIVTFTSCFDTITTINAKPINLKGGIPLGGTYSGPGVNSLTGIFTPATAGIGTKTITYTYTNAAMCTALAHAHIINYPLSIVNCGSPITDIRDNKVYQTVQIGSQCWLASNLNFGTVIVSTQDQRDNCVAEKYCYNDNPTNCTNYGGLYQWDELMQYDDTPRDQGFCPPGWHIPSENDWNTLFAHYISNAFAGSPLKYSGYSGFNALLSGARYINKAWDFQGFETSFWSSTPRSSTQAWAHGMNEDDPSVSIYPASRVNAFSVRCLKD